jgi:hypothetical protein
MSDRVFGDHEAAAMFEAIGNALGVLGPAGSVSGEFLRELRAERELLLAHQLGLARLYDATNSENFNRTGKGEMSTNLRAALRQARAVLDGSPSGKERGG